MNEKELWQKGVPFFDAWDVLADDHERQGFRDATQRGAKESRLLLMQADLVTRLKHDDLMAFGIRVHDAPYLGPERIPAQLFDFNAQIVQAIFSSDDGQLRLAGRTWKDVTVIKSPAIIEPKGPSLEASSSPKVSTKKGRPPVGGALDQIAQRLEAEGVLVGLTRKAQEHILRQRAQSDDPKLFPAGRPSRVTILEPFRKVVESDESVVIQGAVGGHRACGQKITVEPQIVEGFGIRAI